MDVTLHSLKVTVLSSTSEQLDVTGDIALPADVEMVSLGDNIDFDVELITPVAMDKESSFRDS